ncbi:unnamed protein product [Schistosoma margrebowiei]|uniref:Uncharacterized protein n=1 Tax=Schistosoma margrebowiei TaxID=48269 RepID=A0A183MEE1_9TREM|nr:unnamed protein product [Schistosoma margrebowiei]
MNRLTSGKKTSCLAEASTAVGLNIYKRKSEILRYNTTCASQITLVGEALEDVENFTYLSSIIDEHGGSDAYVKALIGKARAAYLQLNNIWKSKKLSTNTKVRISYTNIKTVLLCRVETSITMKVIIQKIQVFINSCLCKILRICWSNTKSNNLLWERTKPIRVDEEMSKKCWMWIGHTVKKALSCVTKQVLTCNPQCRRR